MLKYLKLLALFLLINACGQSTKKHQIFEVEFKGALKNIMHKGDLSSKVSLSDFENYENFYALGAMENLKGEIQIFNSQPNNTFVKEGELKFDKSFSKEVTLLVYAMVENWISIQIPNEVVTRKQLEIYIEKTAKANDIDTQQPFPFLIEGRAQEMDWHVINWKDGDTEHSHEKHITSGLHGILKNKEVDMLGFYSNAHHAIFTHHTTNMHIHMKLKNGSVAGHVDDLKLGQNMILKLPEN